MWTRCAAPLIWAHPITSAAPLMQRWWYYNHANRAYFLCKSYLFVKFFVIFLFIANVTLANGNGTSELYDIKKGTLLEYFKDIEKETGYVFIYSKDIRPSLNQVVSVDLSRKKTITEKLSALFEKQSIPAFVLPACY